MSFMKVLAEVALMKAVPRLEEHLDKSPEEFCTFSVRLMRDKGSEDCRNFARLSSQFTIAILLQRQTSLYRTA